MRVEKKLKKKNKDVWLVTAHGIGSHAKVSKSCLELLEEKQLGGHTTVLKY